jgi:hypothetical protein
MAQQEQMGINIPLSKTLPVICESCGNDTFKQVIYIRKVSKFLVGSPEDIIKPVPTFACDKCSYINEDFKLVINDEE